MILDDFQWVMLPVETKVSLAPWTWRSPTGWMTWVCETAMSSTFMPNAFQRSIYIVKLAGGKQNTLIYLDFFLINNFWRSVWFHILPFFVQNPSTEHKNVWKKTYKHLSFSVLKSTLCHEDSKTHKAEGSQNAQCDGAQFENQVIDGKGWTERVREWPQMTTRINTALFQ